MRKTTLWLTTALITFFVGVSAAAIWLLNNRLSAEVPAVQENSSDDLREHNLRVIDPRWVYINNDVKWESPPKELHDNYQYSVNEQLLIFYPDGEFASVTCTIYRNSRPAKMQLVPNSGFALYKGKWARSGPDKLVIMSSLASSSGLISVSGEDLKREHSETLNIRKTANDRLASELELNDKVFVPSQEIDGLFELLALPADMR